MDKTPPHTGWNDKTSNLTTYIILTGTHWAMQCKVFHWVDIAGCQNKCPVIFHMVRTWCNVPMVFRHPWCRQPKEDKPHIIQCFQEAANGKLNVTLKHLKEQMQTEQLDPQLTGLLITELQAWHNGEPNTNTSLVAQKQLKIGWDAALDSWLSLDWHATQEPYWLQWLRCKSSKWWTAELIKKLWNIAWDMWDHCNKALHNSTNPHDDIIESKINDQVQEIFAYGLHAIPWDAFPLYQGTVEELLQHLKSYKEQL